MLFVLQMQPSVPHKSLGGEDWLVCPKGLSNFRVKTSRPGHGKQNHSLQKLTFAKRLYSCRRVTFTEKQKKTSIGIWRTATENIIPLSSIFYYILGKGIKVYIFLHSHKQWKKPRGNGVQIDICVSVVSTAALNVFKSILGSCFCGHPCESLSSSHINKQ